MAVLVEAISIIIRIDSVGAKFAGGLKSFYDSIPNQTFCTDEQICRVGFMSPYDSKRYADYLELAGLQYLHDGNAQDFAVVDQQTGLLAPCLWLEIGRLPVDDAGNRVMACWYFDGPRHAEGYHFSNQDIVLALPVGWKFQGSLSESFGYVSIDEKREKLHFLRIEGANEVYLNKETGKVVYIGRTGGRSSRDA